MTKLFILTAGALGVAAIWQGNEALDKVGTLAKWGVAAGGVYVAGKYVKAW
ncbi:MAG: hypothetical protein AAFY01_01730 [Pseudomonadota bacterium]